MPLSEGLLTDEKIVLEAKKHWVAPVRDSGPAVLMILAAGLLNWLSPDGDGFFGMIGNLMDIIRLGLFVAGVAWIVYNIIAWRSAAFAVTNYRVLRDEGLIQRRSSTTLLTALSDVKSNVPFMGARLGYGDVIILTQSGNAGEDRFTSITGPLDFRKMIMEQKMQGGQRAAVAAAPAAATEAAVAAAMAPTRDPASTGSSAEAAEALARLADLHASGAITDAEFDAKKTEILARM